MRTKKTAITDTAVIKHHPLGTHLEKSGFAIDLVKREGDLAIFKRQRIRKAWCNYPTHPHWEVVIIKRHNGYSLGNQYIEPAETYPCNTLFGILGWNLMTLEAAEEKFQEILERIKKKEINVQEITSTDDDSE
jgi:hypothetical protein